jgi:hypothetical protein
MSKYGVLAREGIQGRATTRDDVVLAPANLLTLKSQWQKVANSLPQGGVLVVLPALSRQAAILEQVAKELRKIGRNVTTMSAEAHELIEGGEAPRALHPRLQSEHPKGESGPDL